MNARLTVGSVIAAIRREMSELPADSISQDFLLYVESCYSLAKLEIYLYLHGRTEEERRTFFKSKYTQYGFNPLWTADKPASLKSLAPLVSLVESRAALIDKTDAMPLLQPSTKVNRAYLSIAHYLSTISQRHPYSFLLPRAILPEFDPNDPDEIYQYPFHTNILMDNGVLLSIPGHFERMYQMIRPLADHLNPLQILMLDKFTEPEKNRLSTHSPVAKQYYDALLRYAHFKNVEELEQARDAFQSALKNDYQVTATYGESGRDRLKARLFAELQTQDTINYFFSNFFFPQYTKTFVEIFADCFTTVEILALFLQRHVRKDHWEGFLACFSDQKLGGLVNSSRDANPYQSKERYDLALAYILTEEYVRNRSHANDVDGYMASSMSFLGGMVGLKVAYTKADKIGAAKAWQVAIIHHSSINQMLMQIESGEFGPHKGALFSGELGKVSKPFFAMYGPNVALTQSQAGAASPATSHRGLSVSSWIGWG